MNNKFLRYTFYVLCLTAFDQITKVFFASRDFFIGFMHFHLAKNFGLSFGADFGDKINSVIILLVLALFVIYFFRQRIGWPAVLLIAGAFSNILDRIAFGYVRDFLDIG